MVLPTPSLRRSCVRAALRSCNLPRQYATSSTTVPLAYHLHSPPASSDPPHESPLVIMHGVFGSKQNTRSITLAKTLNTPVYSLDLRNHGDSPHVPEHDYASMAADVEAFLSKHGLDDGRTVLLGHSMGAKTAMAVALRAPSLVSRIIAVDNAPIEATLSTSFGSYVQAMRRIEEARVARQSEADAILAQYEKDVGVRQFLLTNLVKDVAAGCLRWRVPVRTLGNALDRLGGFPWHPDQHRFEKPALFIRGSRSHYVPDEVIPVIGRFFPLFRLVDIDAGHWVISEKPNEFMQAVVEFMRDGD